MPRLVPELALDHDQRHAFARHLDRVRVAQLVRREAPPHASLASDVSQLGAGGGGRPRPPARGTGDDAEHRSDRQLHPRVQPRLKLLERPVVHADLAPAAALAAADEERPAARVEVGLGERERLVDAQAGAPDHGCRSGTAGERLPLVRSGRLALGRRLRRRSRIPSESRD